MSVSVFQFKGGDFVHKHCFDGHGSAQCFKLNEFRDKDPGECFGMLTISTADYQHANMF